MSVDTSPRTLAELLERQAVAHADRAAVCDDDQTLSYAELAGRARAVGRLLLEHGVRRGDRVAVQGANSTTWVVAAFGALCAGATVVPVGHRVMPEERRRLLDALRPALVLADAGADPASDPVGVPVVGFDVLRGLAPLAEPLPTLGFLDGADVALVLSSSGTSGGVTSVPMTHWQLLRLYDDTRLALGCRSDDVWLGAVPLAHSFGFNGVLLVSLLAGSCVRLLPEYDVGRVLALVGEGGLSVLAGPPTIYRDLADGGARPGGPVRLGIVGSTEVSATEMAELAAALGVERVVTGYGMTEACGTVAIGELPRRPQGPLPWMPVMPGVEVRVCDELGRELPVGERGRVQVRGYNLCRPYTGAPDLQPGGWYDTGDVGELDGAGRLAVVGRRDDTVNVSGFNVYPREVEAVLAEHPTVAAAAVVGVADPRRGRRLVGVLVPAEDGPDPLDPAAVERHAREHLTAFKVPREYVVLDALPVTGTGKVSRAALRRMLEAERSATC